MFSQDQIKNIAMCKTHTAKSSAWRIIMWPESRFFKERRIKKKEKNKDISYRTDGFGSEAQFGKVGGYP